MIQNLVLLLLAAIALPSAAVLAIFSLKTPLVFLTFSINIVALTLMLLNIQSIGLNIWTISLIFIFINNIILTFFILVIVNQQFNNKLKDNFAKLLEIYIKIVYINTNFILRKLLSFISNMLNIFNNRINNWLYDYVKIEPLKFLYEEYNEETKANMLTFENNKLLDHKNLFVALFTALMLQPTFTKAGKKIMIVSICNDDRTFYIHYKLPVQKEN
uniref:Uncharacterized protein n=1 Tax=Russula compacta TaxID=40490 RepID=A0A2S0U3I9_9AGAM|nr:hypothetical protein [Russula compacta]AWB36062.1 hypothetical protein [Russula compacta]